MMMQDTFLTLYLVCALKLTINPQAPVPVFGHKVAQFVCVSLLAWVMQVHNISVENLTWEQRDKDK